MGKETIEPIIPTPDLAKGLEYLLCRFLGRGDSDDTIERISWYSNSPNWLLRGCRTHPDKKVFFGVQLGIFPTDGGEELSLIPFVWIQRGQRRWIQPEVPQDSIQSVSPSLLVGVFLGQAKELDEKLLVAWKTAESWAETPEAYASELKT